MVYVIPLVTLCVLSIINTTTVLAVSGFYGYTNKQIDWYFIDQRVTQITLYPGKMQRASFFLNS